MMRWYRNTTAEKASFNSNKSISSTVKPAFFRAFCEAGAGPANMMVGSVPVSASHAGESFVSREAVIWTVQEIDRVNKSNRFERRY